DHPANFGKLCSKGSALGETLNRAGRLLHPHIRGQQTSWDEALDYVANGFRRIIERDGPDAVALYVSGQLLTEDYYVANKLMKGYIGSANIDTNSRLCMSSAVAGHKRAFGEDVVPVCYDDVSLADLVVLVGSNTAWCHPVLFQRITAARQERPHMKIVVIDPRRTATCEFADLHLPVRAGTDVWLFNGLLAFLHHHGAVATQFVERSTSGVDKALRVAEKSAGSVREVAKACGVEEHALTEFYRLFARTEKTLTLFSQGVNQSSAGTDKVNSIINCHLLTGRIGRPGMGPFSVTGQPNAMGGREVGGLATTLAAHMDIESADHRRIVQEFWKSPVIASTPGLKAIDLFEAIHEGRVKAVWIMATNPVVSLPDADRAREALRRCELVVASDCVQHTDTTALAHVLLPAAGWAEKDGTVTNSDRRISRQRAFLPLPGEAKPDWWIISQVARRLGHYKAFAFEAANEIFAEHAALSGAQNDGGRAFDIRGLSSLSGDEYDRLAPIQWPVPTPNHPGTERLLSDGRYFHPDGKARFIATQPRPPVNTPDEQFPLVLNTGRVRDQWQTMTRTGYAPRLTSHAPEPYVDMHAQDALLAGTREGELVRVATRWGSIIVRLRITGEMPRGMVFVPMHWNGAFSSDARVGALINPIVDPISGEPEFKHTPARVTPFSVRWHGFVLARHSLASPDVTWWTLARGNQHLRYEIAGRKLPRDWSMWARRLLNAADDADWIEYSDPAAHVFRGALLVDDRISACVYLSPRPDLPSRTWLASLFERGRIGDAERAGLLMGQPADPGADTGAIVCSCFGVGRKTICDAIRNDRLATTQEIGNKLRAGTNCGSCVAEIRALLMECAGGAES
ncbi:MAG TPA: molybdopterin-dependent oxidoreductase, partial [Steroidobacteraceae bacterium]|nr:molybdopterin-dependent oxidoreductase [Steroidobacteraceae bacterium]